MFSFHKPRVYRSADGCCICRAKSSSSRFTDSKKYEEDSIKCFDLREPRHGEICNACVLLVKRYKRLPAGSNRHWGHVVDARAGPGMKSMTKFKKLKDDCVHSSSHGSSDRAAANNQKSLIPEKFSKIFKKNKKKSSKEKNNKSHGIAAVASSKAAAWETQSLPLTPESLDSDCDDVQYSPTRAIESASLKIRQAITQRGSNKRKCLPPKKYRNRNTDQIQFFDENLWVKRKSCCGIVFENKELGAIILDLQNYNPCAQHQRKKIAEMPIAAKPLLSSVASSQITVPQQFNIKTTPYQLPFNPPANRNPTPVLKKHHLFYKRQSESFPLGDMKQMNSNVVNTNTNNPPKTDFVLDFKVLPNSLPTSSAVKVAKLNPIDLGLHNSHLQITQSGKMAAPFDSNHHQRQPPAVIHKSTSSSKSSSFLHKVKSDTGKIVKHSLEKFNTLRLKPTELNDVKHMVKTVDKPFVIKPVSSVSHDKLKKMGFIDNVPCSSSVQSVATKFNDNSSDSGFDENLQDRKSVSPLQDDGEKKIMTIPVQTMYLASGVQIHGQHQNLLLTGNDVAAKILQNRKQIQNNRNGVKIAQIVTGGGHQKMRAIYSQPSAEGSTAGGAVITTVSSTSPNIIAIPSSKTGTITSSTSSLQSTTTTHLTKTSTNIILSNGHNGGAGSGVVNNNIDNSNVISTSVPSLNQKIILVKTKYNNNNQSTCKN